MKEPIIPGGYILISRKLVESEIWDKPPLYIKVWLYLLTKAQHKQYKGLKRGQIYTSIPEVREGCSWRVGFRKEKPTKDQIFQIIDWLRKPHEAVYEDETKATMITTTKATHGLLITIENYDFYQDSKNYESNDESTNDKRTKATREQRQPDNIKQECKNDKNEQEKNKKIIDEIKDLRHQYSPDIRNLIDQYWTIIKKTRKTNKISYSIILKTMKQWNKYQHIVIQYSLKKHIESYDDGEHNEKYTLGIMRNTTPEQAEDLLSKKTITFKQPELKLIKTERPSHLIEPVVSDEVEQQIEKSLKDLPY
ncbi:hypothetical protein BLX88_25885 [Bacillus obstructivus]|nr:hypothetical protein BLX88_25885 [Bacillus obstructivus]